jgi:putative endonuclease
MKTVLRQLGDRAEDFVAQELVKQGFAICERNYQKLYGEIDIIASRDDLLVFVEVKLRMKDIEVMYELITPKKQKKIALVARQYISCNTIIDKVCRFDVALLTVQQDRFVLDYIPHAFQM